MAKTYRDVAIEQMALTIQEAMSRTIDWWGELPVPNEAIERSREAAMAAFAQRDTRGCLFDPDQDLCRGIQCMQNVVKEASDVRVPCELLQESGQLRRTPV
jgi:hypothetical protein